jgi:peptide/nickel transport system permease protein
MSTKLQSRKHEPQDTALTDETVQQELDRPTGSLAVFWRRFRKNRLALAGLVLITLFVFVALLAPWLAPADPSAIDYESIMVEPGVNDYPLGTDTVGRDLLSRIIHGARVSLIVGIIAVGISAAIGITVGLLAGFYGGMVDTVLMRIVDIFLAFPVILLAIAIMGVLEPSLFNVMIALGLVSWTRYARLVRGDVLALKEREFIEAGRALGLTNMRLIVRHVLPNVVAPVIVVATFGMAGAILAEASLSFLGLGVQPPTPSWGSILSDGRSFMRQAPHITTLPGIAIMLTILGFNFVGDGLRDALDPRLKQ